MNLNDTGNRHSINDYNIVFLHKQKQRSWYLRHWYLANMNDTTNIIELTFSFILISN
jgi:hypothetical protein